MMKLKTNKTFMKELRQKIRNIKIPQLETRVALT
jgi:hypothetical protein